MAPSGKLRFSKTGGQLLGHLGSRAEVPPCVQQVLLHIPECVEAVLEELDQATLLTVAQRVCKTWHDTIHSSRSIRKKLFLPPPTPAEGASPPPKTLEPEEPTTRTRNPLLVSKFPQFLDPLEPPRLRHKRKAKDTMIPSTADRFLRPGASWRNMFVEYPPTRKIGYIENQGMSEQRYYSGVVDVPEGVTMGKLYDVAYSQVFGVRPRREGWFGIYWREKQNDPPLHSYSYKCGNEEVALSQMEEDVKIVMCVNFAGVKDVTTRPRNREGLRQKDMPKDLEFVFVQLKMTNCQDWFG